MGYSENAVKWQLWTALLVYVLLRFIAWQSKWEHSFIRLFTALRGVLWSCLDMFSVLKCCGTAGGKPRMRSNPDQCICQGLKQFYLDKKMQKIKNGVADKTSLLNSNKNYSCQFLEVMG